MSELRHDPLSKRWVIIATERSRRPEDFLPSPAPFPEPKFCPFCPGSEDKTPPEITAIRPHGSVPNGPGWEARVFPNKYPALTIEGDIDRRGVGMYDRMRGIGAHEVIVESPRHEEHLADMDTSSGSWPSARTGCGTSRATLGSSTPSSSRTTAPPRERRSRTPISRSSRRR